MVFLTLISWEIWVCNLVQSSQQECVSSSKVTSATFVLALKVSQCPFQLSQTINSQKITVVLGNTSVRKCEGGCLASGVRATLWELAPVQHPLYFSECPIFPPGAPTSVWHCHTGDTMDRSPPRRTWGLEVTLGSLMLFSPSPGEGRASGGGWVPAALEHPWGYQGHQDTPCRGPALFLWCCLLTSIFRGWHG